VRLKRYRLGNNIALEDYLGKFFLEMLTLIQPTYSDTRTRFFLIRTESKRRLFLIARRIPVQGGGTEAGIKAQLREGRISAQAPWI
jgi:hypothetical protein